MVQHLIAGLRPIRVHRRLKAAEMAECIGVAPTSYTRFERGERRIYWDKVIMLANRLGVRTDDLQHALTDDAAARLCDLRDKEAIANGTFRSSLWSPGPSYPLAGSAADVPPPPPVGVSTVPPPPIDDDALAAAELAAWESEQ